jgi:hypothetical protein
MIKVDDYDSKSYKLIFIYLLTLHYPMDNEIIIYNSIDDFKKRRNCQKGVTTPIDIYLTLILNVTVLKADAL